MQFLLLRLCDRRHQRQLLSVCLCLERCHVKAPAADALLVLLLWVNGACAGGGGKQQSVRTRARGCRRPSCTPHAWRQVRRAGRTCGSVGERSDSQPAPCAVHGAAPPLASCWDGMPPDSTHHTNMNKQSDRQRSGLAVRSLGWWGWLGNPRDAESWCSNDLSRTPSDNLCHHHKKRQRHPHAQRIPPPPSCTFAS
eukprot:304273-Chlamydomonas_euryale.AAC.2